VDLPDRLVERLYAAADAARWPAPPAAFREALAASAGKAFAGRPPARRELERYLDGLHVADLALACACAAGVDAAWEHLMRELRPALYRAADAIDPGGRARELADAVWADLFARSLFRYFHGRSSLSTWLRSVLAQRHVDAVRSARRLDPLPEEDRLPPAASARPDPDAERYQRLMQEALEAAIAGLDPRDRLRLACYHAQQLTLAETGRVLHEHEATVSRRLAQTRRALRPAIEAWLERQGGLGPAEVQRCLQLTLADPGALDLRPMLAQADARKIREDDRSKRGVS